MFLGMWSHHRSVLLRILKGKSATSVFVELLSFLCIWGWLGGVVSSREHTLLIRTVCHCTEAANSNAMHHPCKLTQPFSWSKLKLKEYSLGHTHFEFVEVKPNRQHCHEQQCPSSSHYHIQLTPRSLQMQAHCDINIISCRNTNPNPNPSRGVLSHDKDLDFVETQQSQKHKTKPLHFTHSINHTLQNTPHNTMLPELQKRRAHHPKTHNGERVYTDGLQICGNRIEPPN